MNQPHTSQQLQTILQLQKELGASSKFVEPRLVFGFHPPGFTLHHQNAEEIVAKLQAQLLSKRSQATNPNPAIPKGR